VSRNLVLFVADPADDGHADALREVARKVPGAGFFDDPMGGGERTVGTYLKLEEAGPDLARALVGHVAVVSEALAARIEIQLDEQVLGHLVDGVPDARSAAALEEAFGAG
jgi:hypothetical protein